ncbi:glycoside hydrolase family 11 protein [Luteimonas composti]|uniref:endo-1,4-beta-xylanase n=1 Tax=Luteimonas composti TaxID=398257 RepID=A0ABT6MRW6_9GAMM|nr:glycoside hydrolase family 11 protein [Luteimonas composti]MDH7452833.1 glycoside hydrolase family 11 protein [Luteimonas composti]
MTHRFAHVVLTSALILGTTGCGASPAPGAAADAARPQPDAAPAGRSKPPISKFEAYTRRFEGETLLTQSHATGHVGDVFFTHWKDGGEASFKLDEQGNFRIDWIGGNYNYVGGPGWELGDRNRVIGYRLDEDSGASYVTLYGWGYDKDMDPADPAHLVEYYVIQRGVRTPGQGGEQGVSFTSNGVEYTTWRTVRTQKPSINNIATFHQYWSVPTEQLPLGVDHEIVFADHVDAWERNGWTLPDMDNFDASDDPTYQVFAVEVFLVEKGGAVSGRVWDGGR